MGQKTQAWADYVLSLQLNDPPLSDHKAEIAQAKIAEFARMKS
jgi:hypothetical protein